MRIITFCILIFLAFPVALSFAGGGGVDEYATETEVRHEAVKAVVSLIQKGKLESSWGNIEPKEVKEQMGKRGLYEWVVTFVNSKITEEKKKTLYVFLNTSGQVFRVNFSGN